MTEQACTGTLADWLADGTPDKPALIYEDGRRWTYEQLDQWSTLFKFT